MISIRKYLDGTADPLETEATPERDFVKHLFQANDGELQQALLAAYRSALAEMGRCGIDACAVEGPGLQSRLTEIATGIGKSPTSDDISSADAQAQAELKHWGRRTARHYRHKAGEVKEILLAMAQTTASVGQRDARHAQQIEDVTRTLRRIASLDDISQIRTSIELSAAELKSSLDRMTAEGRAALEQMELKVSTFQARLEEAEHTASIDALTRLRSRMWVETQLQQRIAAGTPFCVAVVDIDEFKVVNDLYGHVVGDALLKQFATELRSSCRATDTVARWGGDEFLIVLDGLRMQCETQMERVSKWVCGQYSVQTGARAIRLHVSASIGVAEWAAPETLPQFLERADLAMYERKMAERDR